MGVKNEIFPSRPSEAYVQTEWSSGWSFAVIGFAEAARMLTDRRAEMHASVDQIGLAVFYLQRHRVELIIKQALIDGLGQPSQEVSQIGHSLAKLWGRLGVGVAAIDSRHWKQLDENCSAFVAAIHDADAGSFSYRYPDDRDGEEISRPAYIDLDALERHAESFEGRVQGYFAWLQVSQSDPAD